MRPLSVTKVNGLGHCHPHRPRCGRSPPKGPTTSRERGVRCSASMDQGGTSIGSLVDKPPHLEDGLDGYLLKRICARLKEQSECQFGVALAVARSPNPIEDGTTGNKHVPPPRREELNSIQPRMQHPGCNSTPREPRNREVPEFGRAR